MAIFLTGNELNAQLENLFEFANEHIILISPYIKLHDRFASVLKAKIDSPNISIVVVFGKNEDDFSKSMKEEDFIFFKQFPDIEIRFEKRLHAKYYANESAAILTSMNLYNFSQDNNIEAGVLTDRKGVIGRLSGDSLEEDAAAYFFRVIEQSELLFKKVAVFEESFFNSKYKESVIEIDKLSNFFNNKLKSDSSVKKSSYKPIEPTKKMGFCIRTGVQIIFNPKQPMCDSAFQSWKKYSKIDYPEKYCHFSGEISNGETCFSKPILRKNWTKAKETHLL